MGHAIQHHASASPPAPFLVYAMPRSRSFWLSKLLSSTGWDCTHDAIRLVRGFGDIEAFGRTNFAGSCETAAAPWWRLLRAKCPGLRTVTIRRPREAVLESFLRTGVRFDLPVLRTSLEHQERKLDQIEARVPGNLSLSFDDLGTFEGCERVFARCLGQSLDPMHWHNANGLNLQCNLPGLFRYFAANASEIERFRKIAIRWHLSEFAKGPGRANGFTFQIEPLDVLLTEGKAVSEEHRAAVGESTDSTKNYALWRQLEKNGAMQLLTARSNGKIFGYISWLNHPSLEKEGNRVATQLMFYASPHARGLGLKMEREFLSLLRQAGVDEAVFRAGSRGSGPRLGSLFQRLGAAPDGTTYLLNLKE